MVFFFVDTLSFAFYVCVCFVRERARESKSMHVGWGQRERDRESLKQSPHPTQSFKVMTEQKSRVGHPTG